MCYQSSDTEFSVNSTKEENRQKRKKKEAGFLLLVHIVAGGFSQAEKTMA